MFNKEDISYKINLIDRFIDKNNLHIKYKDYVNLR